MKETEIKIPKRITNKIEKFNSDLAEAVKMIEDEFVLLEDDNFFSLTPLKIEGDKVTFTQTFREYGGDKAYEEEIVIVKRRDPKDPDFDDDDPLAWIDDDEFKDWMRFLNLSLRRGKKYFKDYDPNKYDEDPEAEERFLQSLGD